MTAVTSPMGGFGRPAIRYVGPALLALVAGIAGAAVGGFELPWIGFILAALVVAGVFVAATNPERLAVCVFVFSMQGHATYRLFYGRAGSDGIGFPLLVCTGAVVAAMWALSGDLSRTRSLGRLRWPIAGILGATFLSLLFTQERFVGVTETLTAVQLYFVYWLGLNLVRRERDIEQVLRVLFLALAIQSVIHFVQSAMGTGFNLEGDLIEQASIPRPGGTVSSNPAGYASFILPILLIALVRWMARGRTRPVYAALVVLGTISMGLTYTRVAWAGYAFACAFVLVMGTRRRIVDPRRAVWLAVGAVVAAIAFAPTMMERLQKEPIEESYAERAGLMRIAFDVIASNPVTGLGPGAYAHEYKNYIPPSLDDQWLYTVHNEYLLRTAETGILGGVAFVALLILGFRLALRLTRAPSFSIRTMALGWSAGLIALAWQMYWVPWTGFEYNALLWFFFGLSEAAARFYPKVADRQPNGSTDRRVGAGRCPPPPPSSSRAPTSGAFPFHGI